MSTIFSYKFFLKNSNLSYSTKLTGRSSKVLSFERPKDESSIRSFLYKVTLV